MESKPQFVVYKSSAGSGKTTTLASEYLQIALGKPSRFRNILSTTFTNNAAAEMKERILLYLQEIIDEKAGDKSNEILSSIRENTGMDEAEFRAKAKRLLESILHQYGDFAVSTIDSFFQRILRSFAFDLHLSMQYNIELEEDSIVAAVFEQLIDKIGKDDYLTRIFLEYTKQKLFSEERIELEKDIREKIRFLFKDEIEIQVEKLQELRKEDFVRIAAQNFEVLQKIRSEFIQRYENAIDKIQKAGLDHDDFKGKEKSGLLSHFIRCASPDWERAVHPTNTMQKNIDEMDIFHASVHLDAGKIALREDLINAYTENMQFAEDNFKEYIIRNAINKEIWYLAVMKEIQQIMQEYKKEENIVHISDTYKIIKSIIENEPSPYIYERVGEYFQHFLIDEFQDTSFLQWQSFLPLLENSLANGKRNIVVGDAKQSIYRWRNSNASQFIRLPEIENPDNNPLTLEREAVLKRAFHCEERIFNYRSKKEIIDFNNALFATLIQTFKEKQVMGELLEEVYADVEQQSPENNEGGCVDIQFFQEESYANLISNKLCPMVKSLLEKGRKKQDIAILCRSNHDGSLIAKALFYEGIDVISSESLLLGNSPKASFIMAVFAFLHNPDNDIAAFEISSYLQKGFLPKNQLKKEEIQQKLQSIENWLSVYDLGEKIMRLFSLEEKADPFTDFLLDYLLELSQNGKNAIADALEWWEEKGRNAGISVSAEMDAVQISTIHKSKGLQYKVLIYAVKDSSNKLTKSDYWYSLDDSYESKVLPLSLQNSLARELPEIEEKYQEEKALSLIDDINLLYVALTRAVEHLILAIPLGKKHQTERFSGIFAKIIMEKQGISYPELSSYTFGNEDISIHNHKAILDSSKEQKKIKEDYILHSFISKDWTNRLEIASRISREETSERFAQARKGSLLHEALSYLYQPEDIEPTMLKLVRQGLINTDESADIQRVLEILCTDPRSKDFYNPAYTSFNEKEIISPISFSADQKTIEILKPDRVVFAKEKNIIIDYKTGKELAAHKQQLEKYKNALSAINITNIETYLIYINLEDISLDIIKT